jgi:hypothetical protein
VQNSAERALEGNKGRDNVICKRWGRRSSALPAAETLINVVLPRFPRIPTSADGLRQGKCSAEEGDLQMGRLTSALPTPFPLLIITRYQEPNLGLKVSHPWLPLATHPCTIDIPSPGSCPPASDYLSRQTVEMESGGDEDVPDDQLTPGRRKFSGLLHKANSVLRRCPVRRWHLSNYQWLAGTIGGQRYALPKWRNDGRSHVYLYLSSPLLKRRGSAL